MKTTKRTTLLLALTATFVAASVVSAQPRFKQRHHRQGGLRLEVLAEELALSDEQISQLEEQRLATAKSAIEMRSKIQVAELELRQLMKDGDENQIINKVKEIGNLKTDLRLNRVEGQLAMKKVLTAEQLEKLESLRKERFQNRGNRRGPNRDRQRPFRNFRRNRGGPGFGEFGDLDSEPP
ncbi:MAG: Spy/CpxP family protein refolding chaperone, partial [bacterium]